MNKADLPSHLIKEVKGFLDEEEGLFLYRTAERAASRGPCLEVGSYCGKSAIYLGMGCRAQGGILFSIDHHRGSEEQQPGEEYFDPALFDPLSAKAPTRTIKITTIAAIKIFMSFFIFAPPQEHVTGVLWLI